MLNNTTISERNGYLIALIAKLDLGIHIVDLPHKPKMLSADYQWKLNGYVKNFQLILCPEEFTDKVLFQVKLKSIEQMDVENIRNEFLNWMVNYNHRRIFTVSDADSGMFVTGFDHHNKVLKLNPYPVFAQFNPLVYYDKEKADAVVEKFTDYNLKVN